MSFFACRDTSQCRMPHFLLSSQKFEAQKAEKRRTGRPLYKVGFALASIDFDYQTTSSKNKVRPHWRRGGSNFCSTQNAAFLADAF